jgi:hypothetical protein
MAWEEAQAALSNGDSEGSGRAAGALWIALRAVGGVKAVLLVAADDGARLASAESSSSGGSAESSAVAASGAWSESVKVFSPSSGAHALRAKALRDRYEPYVYEPTPGARAAAAGDAGDADDAELPPSPEALWRAEFSRSFDSRAVTEHVLVGAVLLAWHAAKDALKTTATSSSSGSNGRTSSGRRSRSKGSNPGGGGSVGSSSAAAPRDDALGLRLVRVVETAAGDDCDATAAGGTDVAEVGGGAAAATAAAAVGGASGGASGGGFIGLCLPPGVNAEAVMASLTAAFATGSGGTEAAAPGEAAAEDASNLDAEVAAENTSEEA